MVRELAEMKLLIEQAESGQQQAEKALREIQPQLQQAQKMETLGTLVAGVAHEINNPINLIMYNIPLLKKIWVDFLPLLMERRQREPERKFGGFDYDFLADNLSQLVIDIEMAAQRIAKTVSDLKNFSRQSNVAEKVPLQVNSAVKNALRLAQTTLRSSDVKIKLNLADDLPDIEGNLQSIEQIILNITINAVHAVDHNRGEIEISTGLSNKDGMIYIRITDNGRGISPEISNKIFLPFVTDKQSEGGTGLGLSVTYSLVKAHDGKIDFETSRDRGTSFNVYLPTLLKNRAAKILVVDDDDAIRELLIEALTMDQKYLVKEASNGTEALIKLGTYRPDLLILDIFMPEMDGLTLLDQMLAQEPEIRIIMMTGHGGVEEAVAADLQRNARRTTTMKKMKRRT